MKRTHVLLWVLFLLSTGYICEAANVRGQMRRLGPNGPYTVGGITVILRDGNTGTVNMSTPAVTGPDGMYYFYGIAPGAYFLDAFYGGTILGRFRIGVGNSPNQPAVFWDIGPILLP